MLRAGSLPLLMRSLRRPVLSLSPSLAPSLSLRPSLSPPPSLSLSQLRALSAAPLSLRLGPRRTAAPLSPPLAPLLPLLPLAPARGLKTRARQIKRAYRTKTTYKLKSKKAVLARFKAVGGKGGTKLKFWRRGRVHNSQAKTQKQHRQLRRPKYLTQGKLLKKYKRAMLVR